MKRLIIIGNGFDKAHGLKTTFDDFIKSSPIYADKYSIFKNAGNEWRNIEDRFKDIIIEKLDEIGSVVDIEEIVEEIIDSYGTDDFGEVSYYDYESEAFKKEIEVISKIVLLLIAFESDFLNYLRNLYSDSKIPYQFYPMTTLKKLFNSADRVINFNYTNVIELLYGFNKVDHIHGNINDEIVIGCDTFNRIEESAIHTDYPSGKGVGRAKDILIERMKYYEYDMDNNLVEKEPIKRFFDDVAIKSQNNEEELYRWLKIKSKDFLEFRQKIIRELSREIFDEVYIIGHSLGKADWSVINAIKSKRTICYFHDDEDYKSKVADIQNNGWDMVLKPDTEIFTHNINKIQ